MIGLFCGTKTTSSEDFKKVIRLKMRFFLFLGLIGLLTIAVSLLAENVWTVEVKESILGLYLGAGSGFTFISIILYCKNRSLLYNSQKLKSTWVSHSDERNLQISSLAYRVSTAFLIVTLYLAALIGGLWYPILTTVLMAILSLFLLVYMIAYKLFSQRI